MPSHFLTPVIYLITRYILTSFCKITENPRFLRRHRRGAAADKLRAHLRADGRDHRLRLPAVHGQLASEEPRQHRRREDLRGHLRLPGVADSPGKAEARRFGLGERQREVNQEANKRHFHRDQREDQRMLQHEWLRDPHQGQRARARQELHH